MSVSPYLLFNVIVLSPGILGLCIIMDELLASKAIGLNTFAQVWVCLVGLILYAAATSPSH